MGQVIVGVDVPKAGADAPLGHEAFRRSIYIQVRRSQPLAMLHVFDQPVMETNCDRRTVSTVATQSLMLMNSEFILQQSAYLAARARAEAGGDASKQVQAAWQLALARAPEPAELERALAFLEAQVPSAAVPSPGASAGASPAAPAASAGDAAVDALASLCQILLSTNEFLYVE